MIEKGEAGESEWKEYRLGEICDVRDGTHDSPKQSSIGFPLVSSKNLKSGRIDLENVYLISESDFIQINKRSEVNKNDILYSMIGTVGEIAIVKTEPSFAIKNIGLFKCNGDYDLASWIYYYMRSSAALEELHAAQKGSTQSYISLGDLRSFPILLPPLPEQRAIASVLSSLDDKIDLLHRQNKTLESMAETLFRQVVAPADAGEEEGTVANLIDFNPNRKLPKGTPAPYLEMASLSTSTFMPTDWCERVFSSGMKFRNGDTLIARITPCLENGKTAFITFLQENETGWGSTEYIVMRPKEPIHPFFAYTLAKTKDFRDYAEGCLEGTSGRQRVNLDHLMAYPIALPDNQAIESFNSFARSIVPKLNENAKQILTLSKLRDTLLPKLMSGEVRVEVPE